MKGSNLETVVLTGDLDWTSAAMVNTILGRLDPTAAVTIDLDGVTFLDSMGVRILVLAAQRHKAHGSPTRLVNVPEPIRAVLRLSGVCGLFELPAEAD